MWSLHADKLRPPRLPGPLALNLLHLGCPAPRGLWRGAPGAARRTRTGSAPRGRPGLGAPRAPAADAAPSPGSPERGVRSRGTPGPGEAPPLRASKSPPARGRSCTVPGGPRGGGGPAAPPGAHRVGSKRVGFGFSSLSSPIPFLFQGSSGAKEPRLCKRAYLHFFSKNSE